MDLTLDRRTHGVWAVVEVKGELDLYTAFIDSSGLGAIVACLKHIRERGGELALVAPEGSGLRRLMDLTGLDRVLTLYPSLDDISKD